MKTLYPFSALVRKVHLPSRNIILFVLLCRSVRSAHKSEPEVVPTVLFIISVESTVKACKARVMYSEGVAWPLKSIIRHNSGPIRCGPRS